MNALRKLKLLACLMSFWIAVYPLRGAAEDIDIFVGSSAGTADNPNVLIVLDNTSNWARQSQRWPESEQQGQSEVDAIKTVINTLNDQINVGLMEFVTGSGANNNGGFIRYAIRPMSTSNKSSLSTTLTTIYNNINDPSEKRNSNTPYGNLIYDAYNYFAGANQSQSGAATLSTLADSDGYTTTYSRFKSPLSCGTSCAKNFIIFITNPNASGPSNDDSTNTAALAAAGGNTSQLGLPNFTTSTTTQSTSLGNSTQCYSSLSACNTALANTSGTDYTSLNCSNYSAGCACGSSVANTVTSCPSGQLIYTVTGTKSATSTSLGQTSDCYSASSGNSTQPKTGSGGGYPSNSETKVCASGATASFGNKSSAGSGSCNNKYHWDVTCTTPASTTTLGTTSSCYASASACASAYSCPSTYTGGCTCGSPTSSSTTTCSASGGNMYTVNGNDTYITNTPTGTSTTDTNPFNSDEWARFMYQTGVPISGCSNQTVTTYTVDVYNAQPNAQHTSLMLSMAKNGGGKYFNATNKSTIVNDLKQIFAEIQSVNSTFASASLPINATNRSQNENQVFIGMFRPDPDAKPRWFGNVKRYQLIKDSAGDIQLGDANGTLAINNKTGFITDCAVSWWTSDSGSYWSNYPVNPTPSGTCTTSAYNTYSDSPDGPRVEKGAAAEVIRKGNGPTATDTTPTWAENRTIYTSPAGTTGSITTLQTFNTTNTGLSSTLVNWVRGQDTEDEDSDGNKTETRASLHGDVVHSRPLPVNYCTGTSSCSNVTTYYGANDGTLRAVDASTGKEKWAFVAPEFFSKLDRLRTQSPIVAYPNVDLSISPTPTARDYFFDGSLGLYQNADNSKVWIFPTMRRGGRMVYALDVTNSSSPTIKWKFGCDSSTCTTNADGIGQTWSIPRVTYINDVVTTVSGGVSTSTTTPKLVAIMGGGYDTCEDSDTASPSCSSPKGNKIYILDADTGSLISSFSTVRSVIADVALVDMDYDGKADYAYVGDTGGNLYRIAFVAYNSSTSSYTPLAHSAWTITRIAYTSGAGRKFQFAPSVFGGSGKVFVALGSGDRERPLQSNYPYTTPVTNRFYMYRDCLPDGTISASNIAGGDSLDDTTKMNASTATSPPSCDAVQTLAGNCSSNKGWYMDLNNGTGEQTVTSSVISGGMVTFSTNRPIPAASGTCSTPLGEARGYWLNLFNGSGAVGVTGSCGGSASAAFVGGGLPPSPVTGTVTIDGSSVPVVIGAVQKSGGVSSPIAPQLAKPTNVPARKRVYTYIKGDN